MQKLERRRFLQISALSLAGAAAGSAVSWFTPPAGAHLGVQLWSVRDDMNKAPLESVKALAKMGYREVEGFGYDNGKMFGMPFTDFIKVLGDNGIKMSSSHVMITGGDLVGGALSDKAKMAIDAAAKAGQRYVVCPYMIDPDRERIADMVKVYTAAAEYAQKAGVRFGYHNHDFEYTKKGPDGRLIIEWLLHEIDPKIMAMEMDIYWVRYANHNPLDWFRIYPGRWELCHAKDMANSEKRETIEVGDGVIDFRTIFNQSAQAGLKYFIVELEHYKTTPLEGVGKALTGLKKTI